MRIVRRLKEASIMKPIARTIAFAVIGFAVACSETQPMQPVQPPAILSAPEVSGPIAEPGNLHNDIVTAFYEEWPDDPSQRSPEAFCAALTRAANRVLPRYGVPPIVTESDMAFFIHRNLVTWKRAGFDPRDPAANPAIITRELMRQGVITTEEQQLLAQYIDDQPATTASLVPALASQGPVAASANIRVFLDVASASEVLWAGDVRSRVLDGAGKSWGTKVVDGLGALAKLTPILRVLSAATASVLFEEYADDIGDYFANYPPNPPPTLP
jgi:hypothetical protein